MNSYNLLTLIIFFLNHLKESAITAEILSSMAKYPDDQIKNLLKVISFSKDSKKLFEVFKKENFFNFTYG